MQEDHDSVKKLKEKGETSLRLKEETVKRMENRLDELERQVQFQDQQITSDKIAKQISESKLQRFNQSQMHSDAENEQLKKN